MHTNTHTQKQTHKHADTKTHDVHRHTHIKINTGTSTDRRTHRYTDTTQTHLHTQRYTHTDAPPPAPELPLRGGVSPWVQGSPFTPSGPGHLDSLGMAGIRAPAAQPPSLPGGACVPWGRPSTLGVPGTFEELRAPTLGEQAAGHPWKYDSLPGGAWPRAGGTEPLSQRPLGRGSRSHAADPTRTSSLREPARSGPLAQSGILDPAR